MNKEMQRAIIDEEKVASSILSFRWQIRGEVAGTARPRTEMALYMLKRQGIRALLSLTENVLPPQHLAAYDLQAEHLPIPNLQAPTIPQIEQAITIINRFRAEDRPVAVHCDAGLGRTGTILACYLVWQGASAQDAIERVRALQPSSLQVPEQEAAVRTYEEYLRLGP